MTVSTFAIAWFRKSDDERDLTVGGKPPYFWILIRKTLARRHGETEKEG